LSTVTEVDREELRVWRKRLGKLERSGEIQAALAGTREMAARSPESSYPHLMLGELYLRNGDTEASVSAFREAWRVAPRKWKVAPRVARGMSAAGRDEEALGLLRSLDGTMAAGPLSVERALLHRRLGRCEEALEELAKGLETNPFYQPAWDEWIDLLDSLGRSQEAAAARQQRDALPPKYSAAEVVEAINTAFPGQSSKQ
jgi:tetratricopeptide (TPR) repeat protein